MSDELMQPAPSLLAFDDMARGLADDRRLPVPMMPSEMIHIETAMLMAGKCDRTIREWCRDLGIGRQSSAGSHLQISAPALMMKVDGQMAILERFRNGERDHPQVRFYLRKAVAWLEVARLERAATVPTRM
jgi:hypothetical protein